MNTSTSKETEALWQALVANPNDIDRLTAWIEHQDQVSGDSGAQLALDRAAALPGNWLAKIWLTRSLLAHDHLEQSLQLCREALELAPRESLAVQEIGGHLGQAGYYQEAVALLLPIYSPDDHGFWAGLNLFNLCEDAHDLDSAQEVINRMKKARWPDDPNSRQFKRIVQIRQEKLNILKQMRKEPNPMVN